jgi:hypothetical protein
MRWSRTGLLWMAERKSWAISLAKVTCFSQKQLAQLEAELQPHKAESKLSAPATNDAGSDGVLAYLQHPYNFEQAQSFEVLQPPFLGSTPYSWLE